MTFPKLLAPTVTVRLFDPMPLPRKSAAVRRARIVLSRRNGSIENSEIGRKVGVKSGFSKFTYKVRRVPLQA